MLKFESPFANVVKTVEDGFPTVEFEMDDPVTPAASGPTTAPESNISDAARASATESMNDILAAGVRRVAVESGLSPENVEAMVAAVFAPPQAETAQTVEVETVAAVSNISDAARASATESFNDVLSAGVRRALVEAGHSPEDVETAIAAVFDTPQGESTTTVEAGTAASSESAAPAPAATPASTAKPKAATAAAVKAGVAKKKVGKTIRSLSDMDELRNQLATA